MKKLLIILLILIGMPLVAQSRLGSTLEAVKKEFPNGVIRTLENELICYTVEMEAINLRVAYYFEKGKTCNSTAIYPNDIETVNALVEKYNEKYTILSTTKWRAYFSEGINDIDLIFKDNKIPFFFWTFPK